MNSRSCPWSPLALTLLALWVRLHNLTYHSLWFDEVMSVHWARSELSRILEVSMNLVEDRLPPLYYLLLHGWRLLLGDGEVSVRLPSVLLGVLLVPVVYRLGTDLFGRRVAVLAAALTALNPFLVWYSQEARMYALAVLLASLGTWFFARAALASSRQRVAWHYWLGYGLCAIAGLYTHLYTGLVLPAHALYLVLTWRRSRRAWVPFVVTMLVVGGFFAPLALAALRVSGEAGAGQPLASMGDRLWRLLSAVTVWKAPVPPALRVGINVVTLLLALAGLVLGARPSGQGGARPGGLSHPMLLVALLLVVPLVMATLLLLRNQLAFFGERYFIVIVPWLLMAVAVGAVGLADILRARLDCAGNGRQRSAISGRQSAVSGQRAGRTVSFRRSWWKQVAMGDSRPGLTLRLLPHICYVLPVAMALIPLLGQWSPEARKEAWRESVAHLSSHARPEDAILIHPDWTRFPLQYYFRGPGQTYAVFSSVDSDTDLGGPLTVISGRHPVVWLVESHTELADPDHRANAWLAARYPQVTELYPPGLVAVRAYAPGYLSDRVPDAAAPTSVAFEGGLQLVGHWVPESQLLATDDLFHPPSGWVHVTLYWQTESPPAQDYTPFVHLVDRRGRVWGASLERPNDAFDFYPPTRWQAGQVVRADFDVNLNPETPPGEYALVVGLRDAAGQQTMLADGSPQAPLTTVEIVR